MTTVIASHNLREMEDICDTVGLLHKSDLLFVRELYDMKADTHKIQAVFNKPFESSELAPLTVSGFSRRGSLISFMTKGSIDEINQVMAEKNPIFFECLPLTLEEIFIGEMEAMGYDFSNLDY